MNLEERVTDLELWQAWVRGEGFAFIPRRFADLGARVDACFDNTDALWSEVKALKGRVADIDFGFRIALRGLEKREENRTTATYLQFCALEDLRDIVRTQGRRIVILDWVLAGLVVGLGAALILR